jgi:hypothetical protein
MNEVMILPVDYLGKVYELPLTVVPRGYTYQLHVAINEHVVILEKDDHGEYRVIGKSDDASNIDKGIIAAIVATLQGL